MIEMSNIIINTMLSENPVCRPNRSLPQPMNQGPIMPPRPAKVKSTPRIVFALTMCVSDTAAVMVGKMIERKKPEIGKNKEISFEPYKPAIRQIMPPMVI